MKRIHLSLGLLAVVALLAVFAISGHPLIDPTALASIGMVPLALGEVNLVEIKELVTKQGTTWDEYKKANDERLAKLEKGEGTADLEAKLAKMEADLTSAGKELKDLTLKSQRPNLSTEAEKDAETAVKSFNLRAQAAAIESGKTFAPLTAEGYANYKAALGEYIRRGQQGMPAEKANAINVGTSTQGGFLVGYEMEAGIDRVVHRYSSMRQLARVIPIGAASYKKLVKTGGTSGGSRGGETTAPTQGTTQQWAELEIKPGTYLSDQRITQESLEDSVQDVEADLMEEIGIEFSEMEGQDFVNGTGVNGPRGFESYTIAANASYAWGSVGYVAGGGASDFAASNPSDKLIDLVHALKRQYRAGAAWIMNDATLASIRKFKDGQGNYLWGMTAPSNLMAGAVGTLLGYPVATDDFMPDVGAGTYPIAFADWKKAYYVIDRKGMSILRDPFTAVPYVKFVARRRVGGGIANFEALKLFKIATS